MLGRERCLGRSRTVGQAGSFVFGLSRVQLLIMGSFGLRISDSKHEACSMTYAARCSISTTCWVALTTMPTKKLSLRFIQPASRYNLKKMILVKVTHCRVQCSPGVSHSAEQDGGLTRVYTIQTPRPAVEFRSFPLGIFYGKTYVHATMFLYDFVKGPEPALEACI